MANSGLAAPVKPGRREEVSAYRVNWDTTSRLPPTCSRLQVHFSVFVFKDPQVADLVRQLVGSGLRIVGAHPQQHQKAGADPAR